MRRWTVCVTICVCIAAAPVRAASAQTGASKKKSDPCRVAEHTDSLAGCGTGSLERKWQWAEEDGLRYLKNDLEFRALIERGILVALESTPCLRIDPRHLPEKWRWVLPWTKRYLEDRAEEFCTIFGRPLQVNSAVRTVAYQKAIAKKNSNAVVDPPPHTTGATIDLAILPLAPDELLWLQNRFLEDETAGLIEATEEFARRCFDIMVKKPADWAGLRTVEVVAAVFPQKPLPSLKRKTSARQSY
jgi:hypothetical protein